MTRLRVIPRTPPRPTPRATPHLTPDLDPEALVRDHGDLVKRIAYRLLTRMPATVDVNDLIQAGMVGLLCAARQFSPERGASFGSYAGIRIRGAMLDEARRADWAPRSVRRGARDLKRAELQLERRYGRAAQPADVARALGVSLDSYFRLAHDAVATHVVSLEQGLSATEGTPLEVIDEDAPSPDHQFERHRFISALARAIEELPERLKLVLSLYYDEELNLRAIGEVLSVTESRACQLHAEARQRVRARLSGWFDPIDCHA